MNNQLRISKFVNLINETSVNRRHGDGCCEMARKKPKLTNKTRHNFYYFKSLSALNYYFACCGPSQPSDGCFLSDGWSAQSDSRLSFAAPLLSSSSRPKAGEGVEWLAAARVCGGRGRGSARGRAKVRERIKGCLGVLVAVPSCLHPRCLHEGEPAVRSRITGTAAASLYVSEIGEVTGGSVACVRRLVEGRPFGIVAAGSKKEGERERRVSRGNRRQGAWHISSATTYLSALPAGSVVVATTSFSKDWPSSSEECSDAEE